MHEPPAADTRRPPDADRYARLRAAFEVLCALAPDAQEDWLCARDGLADDERVQLRRWLAADAGEGWLETPVGGHAVHIGDAVGSDDRGVVGQSIGGFRLARVLGRGGMATVFLGERDGDGYSQLAAVKLLRRGLYSDVEQRLFQRERRALATLSHHGIARLIDGGITTAGIPFLVMEYVDGEPITEFAAARRLGVTARLHLFVEVCAAVAAAHQRLIVHRDIKPSNILVTAAGAPKLLDFGIAKLLDDEIDGATGTGLPLLTPGYAAPEQYALGSITTATDVFALGVLLRELLVGRTGADTRRPSACVDAASIAAMRMPATERSLRAALDGDLDNIVLKAMATEPAVRYDGAAAMADDIGRYLRREPVSAHPPSRLYRARKFVGRHRGGVLGTLLMLVAVFAALAVALWQAQIARAQARRATEVQAFVEALFEPMRDGTGRDQAPSLDDLLRRGRTRIDARAPGDPGVRADLLAMFARIDDTLGATRGNLDLARDAARANAIAYGERDARSVAAHELHARVLRKLGDYAGARGELERLHALLRSGDIAAQDHARLLDALGALGKETGMAPAEVVALEREALALREGDAEAGNDDLATGYNNLGAALLFAGDGAQARAWFERALQAYQADHADSLAAASVLLNLGVIANDEGDWTAALGRYAGSRAMLARIPIERHPVLVTVLLRECGVLVDMERLDEADRRCAEGEAMALAVHGRGHRQFIGALSRRARLDFAHGRVAEAHADFAAARASADAIESPEDRRFVLASIDTAQSRSWWLEQDFESLRDAMLALSSSSHPRLGANTIGAFHYASLAALACARAPSDDCGGEGVRLAAAARALADPALRRHALYLPSLLALAEADAAAAGIDVGRIEAALAGASAAYAPAHTVRVQAYRVLADVRRGHGDDAGADADAARADRLAASLAATHPLRSRRMP
ncbi:MAG: serine/threonine protein kinase [Xanthomonadales bacterium]|nr:serine/threonine protein kinase [Xanthomonadales bacterium]